MGETLKGAEGAKPVSRLWATVKLSGKRTAAGRNSGEFLPSGQDTQGEAFRREVISQVKRTGYASSGITLSFSCARPDHNSWKEGTV
ncbi:hypothetical protein SAMN02745177_00081 [Desulforamulus hydrothermalis Lam5 = DSM 18033]|nr:hypothetical protein SAMN02745177_00081 [Desulforamulus hydrothermalis Lam5 = DSM 18033]